MRQILARLRVEDIQLVDEQTFEGFVTYPTITSVVQAPSRECARLIRRDGYIREVILPTSGVSWQPLFHDEGGEPLPLTLQDVSLRVSCGVATGADAVFVHRTDSLDTPLMRFAYPTIAGRELDTQRGAYSLTHSMLVPYSRTGSAVTRK